jgi:UDP-N-acetylglucosamine--N-acetylmuramyl-(pentapeptide) pyrophosphoryl-undecaprenol N-acetylglucosamine transferase
MLRAYISPLGIGYGHASRCANLANRLIEEGFSVYFSARGDAYSYLKANKFEVLGGGEEILWKSKDDGSPDFWGTLKDPSILREFISQVLEEKKNIEAISPDVVISDSRLQTIIASEYLGLPTVSVLNQPKLLLHPLVGGWRKDIFGKSLAEKIEFIINFMLTRSWALSQATIVADFPPPFSISKYHTSDLPKALMDRLVFTGPLLEPKCSGGEGNIVLIMISGPEVERKPFISEILDLIREVPGDLRRLEFVISLGDPGDLRVGKLSDNVTIYNWLPDKWDFLSRARVVVSRAGHTIISESLLCGKPLLLIPVPGQTEKIENAKNIQELGLGICLEQGEIKEGFFNYLRILLEDDGFSRRAMEFRERFSSWDFLGRAVSVIEGVIY